MAQTTVNTPNGPVTVNHPEGASREQILRFAKQQFESGAFASPPGPTRAEALQNMPLMDRVKNDLNILGGNAVALLRGIPEGIVDAASPFANPLGVVGNALLPGQPFSTRS